MMTKEDYLKQYKNYQSMRDNVAKDPYCVTISILIKQW